MSVNVKTEDGLLMVAGKPYSDVSYVTPEMFGAKGDGETDDTVAIQNAVNSCTNGMSIVFFKTLLSHV